MSKNIDNIKIIDDMDLLDDEVEVQIVDAVFTNTKPDWSIDDEDSPYYIKGKPTKTSDFINDGETGASKYAEVDDIERVNKIADVQVKKESSYKSVIDTEKVAKIDLSTFVEKEYKTGSLIDYKVLSDNNYTAEDKENVALLQKTGDGTKALTDDGKYKDIYNIEKVNGKEAVNKEITLTTEDIAYNTNTLKYTLDKVVCYNSAEDKTITLDNDKYLKGTDTLQTSVQLIGVDAKNSVVVGDNKKALDILSSGRITNNTKNVIAYLTDITDEVTAHNTSEEAHNDIRERITEIDSAIVRRMTNAEMQTALDEGALADGSLVLPIDTKTYVMGKIYKYTNTQFYLISDYQLRNLYGIEEPTKLTVGLEGQLYFDTANLKIWKCENSVAPYKWKDITPVQEQITEGVKKIINNETVISAGDGSFTAGNGYLLLDTMGMIPVQRIPQAVLQGLIFGGQFDSEGIITASKTTKKKLDGLVIDTIDKQEYKNYYFIASGVYTLDGTEFNKGNIALSSGVEWVKISNSGQVVSVNGYDGMVELTYTDVKAIGKEEIVTAFNEVPLDTAPPSEKLVKTALDDKQDELTAGENITIEDKEETAEIANDDGTTEQITIIRKNVISAKDTKDYEKLDNRPSLNGVEIIKDVDLDNVAVVTLDFTKTAGNTITVTQEEYDKLKKPSTVLQAKVYEDGQEVTVTLKATMYVDATEEAPAILRYFQSYAMYEQYVDILINSETSEIQAEFHYYGTSYVREVKETAENTLQIVDNTGATTTFNAGKNLAKSLTSTQDETTKAVTLELKDNEGTTLSTTPSLLTTDTLTLINSSLETEVTNRTNADTNLQEQITTNKTNIATNTTNITTNTNDITTLKSDKQDKADNSLTTTAKTVVGAINELKTKTDDMSDFATKTYVDTQDNAINAKISTSASATNKALSSAEIDAKINDFLKKIYTPGTEEFKLLHNGDYPVGIVYKTFDTTETVSTLATKFGGTWEELPAGYITAQAGTVTLEDGTTKTFSVGDTYGEFMHKLTEEELPAYTKRMFVNGYAVCMGDENSGWNTDGVYNMGITSTTTSIADKKDGNYAQWSLGGSDKYHNNMQPTVFTKEFKRLTLYVKS